MEIKTPDLSDIAYFVVDAPTHAYPFLGFLSELECKGLNFDVYGSKDIIQSTLYRFGQNHFEFEEQNCIKEGMQALFRATYQSFLKSIPAIEAIWEEKKKKPKLIMADMFSPYSRFLAKKHGIPLLALYSSYFMKSFNGPLPDGFEEAMAISRDDSLIPFEKEVEEKFQVSIKCLGDFFISGDHNISCLPKFIGEQVTVKKDNLTYVGPVIRDENESETLDIDPDFLKDNDIIYVSLGTSPPNILGFSAYDTIIGALKDTKHKVLISAAMGKAEELIAKGLPKNIIVKSWVPQIKILEHSKLFISHVGAGGMMEALSKGVPIIAVPNFADQLTNAKVVEKLNVGRSLRDKSPEGIRELVEEVLMNENIKESCKTQKDLIDPQASKEAFIEIVRSLIK